MAKTLISSLSVADLDPGADIKLQNYCVSYHMTYYQLKEAGIRLNGYTATGAHSFSRIGCNKLMRDRTFRAAIDTLEKGCSQMRALYEAEMAELVRLLDLSDTQLYSNFQQAACQVINQDVNWGRIAALLFFTSVLAERLHNEGHTRKIESLIGWVTTYLNESASTWILENGGWVSECVLLHQAQCPVSHTSTYTHMANSQFVVPLVYM